MTLRHLECAIEIAHCGSINRAAANLMVSQPYLSGIIKSLEDELGYEIFVRGKTGIALTDNGKEFLCHARVIMREMRAINEIGSTGDGSLKVASFYSNLFMRRFLKFRAEKGGHEADSFREMGNSEILDAVMYGDCSLGIIVIAPENRQKYLEMIRERGLKQHVLYDSLKLHAIMTSDHPLASQSSVTREEIRRYPYVCYDDESSRRYLINQIGFTNSDNVLKVSGRAGFYDALNSGVYLSVMTSTVPDDRESVKDSTGPNVLRRDGYVMVPISDADLYLEARYITSRSHSLTEREQQFIDYLR